MFERKIGETELSIFAILDGHGGEYAAVFAKDRLMERLRKKAENAINIATGKVAPPSPFQRRSSLVPNDDIVNVDDKKEKTDDDTKNIEDVKKSPNPTNDRRSKMKKALSTDDDCNQSKSNCNQQQDAFLNRLSSIRLTKESFLKTTNKHVKPAEHDAGYYVDRDNNINFGKMITDLVLLTDYELVERAKKQVNLQFPDSNSIL